MKSIHIQLIDMLKFTLDIFEKNDIKYCLMFGSLLGCIRDGKIIEWDDDIDLIVFFEDREKLIRLTKIKMKYNIRQVNIGFRIIKNNLDAFPFIDLFFYKKYDDIYKPITQYYNDKYIDFISENINTNIKENQLFPFNKAIFEGLNVNIPYKSIQILKKRYGKDCIKNKIKQNKYHNLINRINIDTLSLYVCYHLYSIESFLKIKKENRLTYKLSKYFVKFFIQ